MSIGPLDRRNFLRLATRGRERVLDVSCERLYVRWVDAPVAARPATLVDEAAGWSEEPGEPALRTVVQTREELLGQLDAGLAGAHSVRLNEPEWLAHADLSREVYARIARFRSRGGRVGSAGPRVPIS